VAKKPERLDFFDSKKRKREIPTEGTKKKIIEEPKAKKPRAGPFSFPPYSFESPRQPRFSSLALPHLILFSF